MLVTFTVSGLYDQKFHFGLQAGVIKSNIHVTDNSTNFYKGPLYKPVTFYNINGYLSLRKNSIWGISVEPGFIKKGATRDPINSYDPYVWKNTYSYIQLPVLFDLYFLKNFCLSIGPEFSYLVKSQEKNSKITINTYDQRKKLEMAGILGISYNLFKVVDIGFRYNHAATSTERFT